MLTVLRNRTYLGEVHFRGSGIPPPTRPWSTRAVFDAAQALLKERGEDHGKRASNGSDYLLSGLVVCAGCGRHFCGTRATGRNATYRYYTCGGRQRYGRATCDADRLPADALDAAVVDQLLTVFADGMLFTRAAERAAQRAGSRMRQREQERETLETELAKTEGAIDRYLRAFEAGTLPEAACGSRVKALSEQAAALARRREELDDDSDAAPDPAVSCRIGRARSRVREAIATGSPAVVKELLQALVHEIRSKVAMPFGRCSGYPGRPETRTRFAHCPGRWALRDSNPRPQPCEGDSPRFAYQRQRRSAQLRQRFCLTAVRPRVDPRLHAFRAHGAPSGGLPRLSVTGLVERLTHDRMMQRSE